MSAYNNLIENLDKFIRKYYLNKLIKGSLFFLAFAVPFYLLINFLEYKFYFLGLPRSEESNDPIVKFQFPKRHIFIFGLLLMFNFATIGIIIDWSSLWLTRDLFAPLFLGGLVIVFFNAGEIVARLFASSFIKLLGEKILHWKEN